MKTRKLTPHIGSEILDFSLDAELTPRDGLELRRLLSERGVLFLRDAALAPDGLLRLARLFGEPMRDSHPKFAPIEGFPEIAVIVNDGENPPDINVWHTDTSFLRVPAGVCVLQCVECPEPGGDTLWSSMYAVTDALSPGLLSHLRGLRAEHRLPLDNVPVELVRSLGEREISAMHPLLRWIPETRRHCIYASRVYTRRIEGMHRLESHGLLALLFSLAESPDFQLRFNWRRHSIAIWDNRITQHFAVADYFPARRVMHRVALRGEEVLADDSSRIE